MAESNQDQIIIQLEQTARGFDMGYENVQGNSSLLEKLREEPKLRSWDRTSTTNSTISKDGRFLGKFLADLSKAASRKRFMLPDKIGQNSSNQAFEFNKVLNAFGEMELELQFRILTRFLVGGLLIDKNITDSKKYFEEKLSKYLDSISEKESFDSRGNTISTKNSSFGLDISAFNNPDERRLLIALCTRVAAEMLAAEDVSVLKVEDIAAKLTGEIRPDTDAVEFVLNNSKNNNKYSKELMLFAVMDWYGYGVKSAVEVTERIYAAVMEKYNQGVDGAVVDSRVEALKKALQ